MDAESEIKNRLIILTKSLNMSMRAFSMSIGKSPSWLKAIVKDVSSEALVNILTNYPQVNIKWLLLGEGEMMESELNNEQEKDRSKFLADALPEYMISNPSDKNSINIINNLSNSNKSLAKANETLSESLNRMSKIIANLMQERHED